MTTVFQTMGTVASIVADAPPLDGLRAIFDDFDGRFSLYRPDSELSRIASGELVLMDASANVRDAYEQSLEWSRLTRGAFSAHRPDGVLDLSGIVKAQAMDEAGRLLSSTVEQWMLAVGGDVLASPQRTAPERVGITDPGDRGCLLASVALTGTRRAVATSGGTERGDHIWGSARHSFAQVTVIADDIVTADVLATAIIAGGQSTLDDLTADFDIDVLAIAPDGTLLATPGFSSAAAA